MSQRITTGGVYWMPAFAGMTLGARPRPYPVIPAHAGIQVPMSQRITTGGVYWMPAFAGMTRNRHPEVLVESEPRR